MATVVINKVRYKNHATPQEQTQQGGVDRSNNRRYYLDSDVGRKLSGTCDAANSLEGTWEDIQTGYGIPVTATPSNALTDGSRYVFLFMKNEGGGSGDDLIMTLDDSNYFILLSKGEAFASEINPSAVVKIKAVDSDTTATYYMVAVSQ
tara:strand:+ start:51 stop:497 length:447 start_codon:yes stop_codon:yes gene_type:complete